ncbi:MAG: serine/threonine protein kinase [Planctomycetales bacterium]
MAIRTQEDFFDLLTKSRLLDKDQLLQAKELARDLSEPTTTGRKLVAEGLLSRWQVTQLLSGHDSSYLGKYRLIDELEATATNRLYLALEEDSGMRVNLKTVPRLQSDDDQRLEKFKADVKSIKKLKHPNISRVLAVDQQKSGCYLVTEHHKGTTLDRMVDEHGALPIPIATDYIYQVATALKDAHDRQLWHGDIRPATLLVTADDVVKIQDMGLALLADSRVSDSLGVAGLRPELVDYMAPEQANGHADERSDFYSLGCTFYYLLCGRPPFPHGSTLDRLMEHQEAEAESMLVLRHDTPQLLVDLCRAMMAKSPEERPAKMESITRRLDVWIMQHLSDMRNRDE